MTAHIEIETQRVFSASMLKRWTGCPLSAKFRYVDRLPDPVNAFGAFGTVVHKALEVFNTNNNKYAAINLFEHLWENPGKAYAGIDWWPPRFDWHTAMDDGKRIIEEFCDRAELIDREVLAVEHHFEVTIGEFRLQGYVDCLEIVRDRTGRRRLQITDYKTAGRQPTAAELGYDIQFTCYDYASRDPEFWSGVDNGNQLCIEFASADRRLVWDALKHNKEILCTPRSTADFQRLYRAMQTIEAAWQAGIFVPDISAATCGFCPYHEPCGVSIPTPELLGSLV